MSKHEHSWICGFCECGAYLVFKEEKKQNDPDRKPIGRTQGNRKGL